MFYQLRPDYSPTKTKQSIKILHNLTIPHLFSAPHVSHPFKKITATPCHWSGCFRKGLREFCLRWDGFVCFRERREGRAIGPIAMSLAKPFGAQVNTQTFLLALSHTQTWSNQERSPLMPSASSVDRRLVQTLRPCASGFSKQVRCESKFWRCFFLDWFGLDPLIVSYLILFED